MTAMPAGTEGDGAVQRRFVGNPLIIVGVDGSAASWDAFVWAAGEALRSNGRIVTVFVTSSVEAGQAISGGATLAYSAAADAWKAMTEELAVEVARRADALGVEVRFVTGAGDTSRVLTEVARFEQADLIVVGRSAKMLHRLAGSVSRRLVLERNGPVIVVVP